MKSTRWAPDKYPQCTCVNSALYLRRERNNVIERNYFCLNATLPKPGRSNMLPWPCLWILFKPLQFCRLLLQLSTRKFGCEMVRCNSKTSEILPLFPETKEREKEKKKTPDIKYEYTQGTHAYR